MKKQLIIIFLLCLSVKGISQIPFDGSDSYATPPIGFGQSEFENPLINSINREPYGATSISFPTETEALQVKRSSSSRYQSFLKSATPFPKCYLHKEKWTFDS